MLFIKVGFLLYVLKGYEVLYYEYKCSGYKCQLNMYLEIEFQIIEMYFNVVIICIYRIGYNIGVVSVLIFNIMVYFYLIFYFSIIVQFQ